MRPAMSTDPADLYVRWTTPLWFGALWFVLVITTALGMIAVSGGLRSAMVSFVVLHALSFGLFWALGANAYAREAIRQPSFASHLRHCSLLYAETIYAVVWIIRETRQPGLDDGPFMLAFFGPSVALSGITADLCVTWIRRGPRTATAEVRSQA